MVSPMMSLGSYTFAQNPSDSTIPKPYRSTAVVQTYNGAAFFSWGTFIAGQKAFIKWDYCSPTMFDQLITLLENDEQVVWELEPGNSYNVEILDVDGKFFRDQTSLAEFRKNVVVELVIISEVS